MTTYREQGHFDGRMGHPPMMGHDAPFGPAAIYMVGYRTGREEREQEQRQIEETMSDYNYPGSHWHY